MANDGDMHFPPGQRREKPSFEPPPWERDQFEELARKKQEAEQASSEGAQEESVGEAPSPAGSPQELVGEAAPEPVDGGRTEPQPAGVKGELDDKHVAMLLEGLRAEEPRPEKLYWKIVAGSGVVSILVGLMITTWAVVVIATPKQVGAGELTFEAMLLLLGLGFLVGGGWVVFKSLRQQGVL
jgi:hypothetical protein